jgi:hypothetical protein
MVDVLDQYLVPYRNGRPLEASWLTVVIRHQPSVIISFPLARLIYPVRLTQAPILVTVIGQYRLIAYR